MGFAAHAEMERGEKRLEIETKRCCIKSLAFFRTVVALLTMLLSAALALIITHQTSQNDLTAQLRGKWKTIFWIYSGASLLMLFVALRLVVFLIKAEPSTNWERQSSGVRGLLILGMLMAIFEGYIAGAAFVDSGLVRPAGTSIVQVNEPGTSEAANGAWVSLMALSCTFIIFFLLELLLLVLIVYYHRSMRPNIYSAVESADVRKNKPGRSADETDNFIQTTSDVNGSTEIIHYTNDFTIDKIASDTKLSEQDEKRSGEDEGESTSWPLLPPPNLVINELYEVPERPKLPRKLRDVAPPLPPVNATTVRAIPIPPQEHCGVKPPRMQASLPRPPPPPGVDVSAPGNNIVDTLPSEPEKSAPEIQTGADTEDVTKPQAVNAEQPPPIANGTNTNNPEDLSGSESAVPADEATPANRRPVQRAGSFKRYERKPSLRKKSGSGSNSCFPPYEDTKFAYYDPERGTFARPITHDDDNVF